MSEDRFPTWENSFTEEQARRITTYFLHDARDLSSLCLISTAKSNWLAEWWKKMVQSYGEGVNETGDFHPVSFTPSPEEKERE